MTTLTNMQQSKLIEDTVEFWSERINEPIELDDATEIIKNVSCFFEILQRWQRTQHVTGTLKLGNKERRSSGERA